MTAQAHTKSALVTGGADGIGAGLSKRLSALGYSLTLLDINPKVRDVAGFLAAQGGRAFATECDVVDQASQERAFRDHASRYGSLDIAIINAGIMESGDLLRDEGNAWKQALRVNLEAVMVGVRLAVRTMVATGTKHGIIMVVASAGGIYPMPVAPVYSSAKAGSVMLTRSLGPPLMRRHGIRICALCPQFTDTALVRGVRTLKGDAVAEEMTREVGGRLLSVDQVVDAGVALLMDDTKVGECAVVLASGDVVGVQRARFQRMEFNQAGGGASASGTAYQRVPTPTTARKVVVTALSNDFRKATAVVEFPVPSPSSLPPDLVLVKNVYAGVNASDVNFTSGRYQSKGDAVKLPFEAGFEACGVVAGLGPETAGFRVGQPVATMQYGGFSEYAVVPAKQCLPVQRCAPEVVALLTSGLTASISLEQAARMGSGEKVLITAAAGGTGQFYVQLAKAAGNHVIATCSSAEKAAMLRRLGADRVINYKEESVAEVLKKEYPGGIDLVAELVGGDMFKVCLNALAPRGRLLVIGAMSQYSAGWQPSTHVGLPEKLLKKSASLVGFFLPLYAVHFKRHLQRLQNMVERGKLHVGMDSARFRGVEEVVDAVERLQSGASAGKVYVQVGEAPGNGGAISKL